MATKILSDTSAFIDKSVIMKYFKQSLNNELLEYECVIDQKLIDKKTFLRVLSKLKDFNDFNYEEHSLDIRCLNGRRFSDVRITINGLDDIKKYCKTDTLDVVDKVFVKKQLHKEKFGEAPEYTYKLNNSDYDYRINIKSEVPLEEDNPEVLDTLMDYSEKNKHFRYKKRYSFVTYDKLFRFDLTVVKSPNDNERTYSKTFKGSQILMKKENYEIEIEYIGSQLKPDGSKSIDSFYQDILDGKEYKSPYNLYFKKSPNPYGLFTPVDFLGAGHGPVDFTQSPFPNSTYSPDKPIPEQVSVFKDVSEIKKKTKEEKLDEIDGQIEVLQEAIQDLDEDNMGEKEGLEELIKELEQERKEVEAMTGGAGQKLPDWAKVTEKKVLLDKDLLSEKLFELFGEHLYYIYTIIYDTQFIMSIKEKNDILESYFRILHPERKVDRRTKRPIELTDKQKRLHLPQPITLSTSDVNPINPNNILLKYAVTEKADGDRYLLYIKDNHGYMINVKKEVIDTGVEFPDLGKDYVFDGEYITKNINDEDIKLFMIFDVYYEIFDSTINYVHKFPFYLNAPKADFRHRIIKEFNQNVLTTMKVDENSIRIGVKHYDYGKIISENEIGSVKYLNDCKMLLTRCNNILTKSEKKAYEYRIDGLIFIPLFNAVKAETSTDKPDYIGGKWNRNFKWKPPEENTIDFQVKYIKEKVGSRTKDKEVPYTIRNDDGSEIMNKYKQLQLLVKYDKKDDKSLDYCMRILDDTVEDKGELILFNPDPERSLHQTNIPLNISNKKVICERDGREINDNDIVEMRYERDGKNNMIWTPLRIRDDKTEPQYFVVANNVWSTIKYPVTEELIRNKVLLKDFDFESNTPEDEKNKYYVSSDFNPITESLRKLHNYIKSNLIVGVCSTVKKAGGINILDMSIGRGGDIQKYIQRDANPKFILGLDISSNVTEACYRYYHERKDKPMAAFLVADTSQNIMKGDCYENVEASEKEISHSQNMLNILFNGRKAVPKEYKNIQKKYNNLGLEKFDVISSQFTFHYYFEDEGTFDGFMTNIKETIAPGGYFIGTCYDGGRLFDLLKTNGDQEFKDDNGELIYSIKKAYEIEDFTYDPGNVDNMFGQKIDVFMESIGQTFSEYLVNFDFFRDYMEKNGFKLMSPTVKKRYSKIFKQNNITKGFGDFGKVIANLTEIRDDEEVLQDGGYYEKALDIIKPELEPLRLLSSLNNYFIFQKV